jgi:hypothetical protein
VAESGSKAFVVRRTAVTIIDDASSELVRVAAVSADIFPSAQTTKANGATGRDITVAIVVIERIPLPLATIHHCRSPVVAFSNSPTQAWFQEVERLTNDIRLPPQRT